MVCVGHTGRAHTLPPPLHTQTHTLNNKWAELWCKRLVFSAFVPGTGGLLSFLSSSPPPFSPFTFSAHQHHPTTPLSLCCAAKDRNASPNRTGLLCPLEFRVCLPGVLWQVRERSLPGVSQHGDADSSGGWLFVPLSFSFTRHMQKRTNPAALQAKAFWITSEQLYQSTQTLKLEYFRNKLQL